MPTVTDGAPARPATLTLTGREQDVLLLAAELCTAQEISERLAISKNTVKSHLRTAFRKLGAGNRRDAVRRARHAGLLPTGGHMSEQGFWTTMRDHSWEIQVTVLIPRDEAKTQDDAIDLLGERLAPWPWAGQLPMDTGE